MEQNSNQILPKVIAIDDEVSIIQVLEIMFNNLGYTFDHCIEDTKAVQKVKEFNPDVILQDMIMPNITGKELIKEYRKFTDVPVIMVTAISDKKEISESLDLGADDYLVKPYDIQELLSRINAQFRRYKNSHSYQDKKEIVVFENIKIDPTKRNLRLIENGADRPITLSGQENNLFWYLWDSKRIVGLEEISESVFGWGTGEQIDSTQKNTIISAIKRLREKIEKDAHNPKIILSVRSKGYYIGI
ncbi:MAG: response regulator transcription factor [Bifidobacteriaceae bacterium]|jgi:two-component system response regulator MtrA|nr:response regulator transcription factor [Bifidobacteriaceae bacterium]